MASKHHSKKIIILIFELKISKFIFKRMWFVLIQIQFHLVRHVSGMITFQNQASIHLFWALKFEIRVHLFRNFRLMFIYQPFWEIEWGIVLESLLGTSLMLKVFAETKWIVRWGNQIWGWRENLILEKKFVIFTRFHSLTTKQVQRKW